MYNLQEYLNSLDESYSSTISKRGRSQKIKSTSGAIAVSLAKKKNDPLYKKMIYYKHLYMKTKEQLNRKYRSKSLVLARQKAANYKKG